MKKFEKNFFYYILVCGWFCVIFYSLHVFVKIVKKNERYLPGLRISEYI